MDEIVIHGWDSTKAECSYNDRNSPFWQDLGGHKGYDFRPKILLQAMERKKLVGGQYFTERVTFFIPRWEQLKSSS